MGAAQDVAPRSGVERLRLWQFLLDHPHPRPLPTRGRGEPRRLPQPTEPRRLRPPPLVGRVRVGAAQDVAPRSGVERLRPQRSLLDHPHPRPLPTRGRGEPRRSLQPDQPRRCRPLPPVGRVRVGAAQDVAPGSGVERLRPRRFLLNHPHPRPLPARGRGEPRRLPRPDHPRRLRPPPPCGEGKGGGGSGCSAGVARRAPSPIAVPSAPALEDFRLRPAPKS